MEICPIRRRNDWNFRADDRIVQAREHPLLKFAQVIRANCKNRRQPGGVAVVYQLKESVPNPGDVGLGTEVIED